MRDEKRVPVGVAHVITWGRVIVVLVDIPASLIVENFQGLDKFKDWQTCGS